MFEVLFYEDRRGRRPGEEVLVELRKKSQKTPVREIDQARSRLKDHLERKG